MTVLPWLDFSAHNAQFGTQVRAYAINHPDQGRLVLLRQVPDTLDLQRHGFLRAGGGSWYVAAKRLNLPSLRQDFPRLGLRATPLSEIDLTAEFLATRLPAENLTPEDPAEMNGHFPWQLDKSAFESRVDEGYGYLFVPRDGAQLHQDYEHFGRYGQQLLWAIQYAEKFGHPVPSNAAALLENYWRENYDKRTSDQTDADLTNTGGSLIYKALALQSSLVGQVQRGSEPEGRPAVYRYASIERPMWDMLPWSLALSTRARVEQVDTHIIESAQPLGISQLEAFGLVPASLPSLYALTDQSLSNTPTLAVTNRVTGRGAFILATPGGAQVRVYRTNVLDDAGLIDEWTATSVSNAFLRLVANTQPHLDPNAPAPLLVHDHLPAPLTQDDAVNMVDELDLVESTRANMAGETPARAMMVALHDYLDAATDTMNDGGWPASLVESAIDLIDHIEEAMEDGVGLPEHHPASDTFYQRAIVQLDEWLSSGDLGEFYGEIATFRDGFQRLGAQGVNEVNSPSLPVLGTTLESQRALVDIATQYRTFDEELQMLDAADSPENLALFAPGTLDVDAIERRMAKRTFLYETRSAQVLEKLSTIASSNQELAAEIADQWSVGSDELVQLAGIPAAVIRGFATQLREQIDALNTSAHHAIPEDEAKTPGKESALVLGIREAFAALPAERAEDAAIRVMNDESKSFAYLVPAWSTEEKIDLIQIEAGATDPQGYPTFKQRTVSLDPSGNLVQVGLVDATGIALKNWVTAGLDDGAYSAIAGRELTDESWQHLSEHYAKEAQRFAEAGKAATSLEAKQQCKYAEQMARNTVRLLRLNYFDLVPSSERRDEVKDVVVNPPPADWDQPDTLYDGARIYKTVSKGRNGVSHFWAVQSRDNIGTEKVGGDSLLPSLSEALRTAELEYRQYQEKQQRLAQIAEHNAKIAALEAAKKADTADGFISPDTAPNRASLILKALDKGISVDGKAWTQRDFVKHLMSKSELTLTVEKVPKIKDASRKAWFRMDQREQEAFTKRQKEAGMKTLYLVSGYDLGKTVYDYADHLLSLDSELDVRHETKEEPENPALTDGQVLVDQPPVDAESVAAGPAPSVRLELADLDFSGLDAILSQRSAQTMTRG